MAAIGRDELRRRCAAAKERLSSADAATVDVIVSSGPETRGSGGPGEGGAHRRVEVRREDLESAMAPLLAKAEQLVRGALEEAGVEASEVQEVVLVGGSSRIPAIQAMLRRVFPAVRGPLHPEKGAP